MIKILALLMICVNCNSCATNTVYQCDYKIGIERDMCLKEIRDIQYRIWKYQTLDGYNDYGSIL